MTAATDAFAESPLRFDCAGDMLIGIVAAPTTPARAVGVVIVVGGPQYRAGSHRQFVLLARHLAAAGHVTLRFDVRGMGDSGGEARDFDQLSDDIGAAVGALLDQRPQLRRVVLLGLCDGASAALLYLHETPDPRVAGLCLVNPWVRSDASLARTHVRHYYLQRLSQAGFWTKLLSGRVASRAVGEAIASVRLAWRGGGGGAAQVALSYQERMAAAWRAFRGPLLLVLSAKDYTAREFADQLDAGGCWDGAWTRPRLRRLDVEGADHTFSTASHRVSLEEATASWLAAESFLPDPSRGSGAA